MNEFRRLLVAMLWIDVLILVTSPLALRTAPAAARPEMLANLWAIAAVAMCLAVVLKARPPPRR